MTLTEEQIAEMRREMETDRPKLWEREMCDFRKDIEETINRHSKENGSNTPDFILAEYLTDCLATFDKAIVAREQWYGRAAEDGVLTGVLSGVDPA